jgi:hypothetical protein
MLVFPEQFQGDVAELFDIFADIEAEDARVVEQSCVVVLHREDEELLLAGIPVRPDALEDPGPVLECIRADADLGFLEWDDLVVEKCETAHGHPRQPFETSCGV